MRLKGTGLLPSEAAAKQNQNFLPDFIQTGNKEIRGSSYFWVRAKTKYRENLTGLSVRDFRWVTLHLSASVSSSNPMTILVLFLFCDAIILRVDLAIFTYILQFPACSPILKNVG